MSATACNPVNNTRSSAGPQPTLTLREEQRQKKGFITCSSSALNPLASRKKLKLRMVVSDEDPHSNPVKAPKREPHINTTVNFNSAGSESTRLLKIGFMAESALVISLNTFNFVT